MIPKGGKLDKIIKDEIATCEFGLFEPLSPQVLIEILGLTIKKDEQNKLITYLCELSAYTNDSQFNISFNAPSSTGKSYIPTEIARLFPKEDIIEVGYCSPTAFFHDYGIFDKETGRKFLDELLSCGGSDDFLELFKRFRGREPSVEPLLRHSGIKQ